MDLAVIVAPAQTVPGLIRECAHAGVPGARVALMTSSLLKNGIGHPAKVLNDLQSWMNEHEYHSIHQMQGSMSHWAVAEPAAFERVNYMRVLGSYTSDKAN